MGRVALWHTLLTALLLLCERSAGEPSGARHAVLTCHALSELVGVGRASTALADIDLGILRILPYFPSLFSPP